MAEQWISASLAYDIAGGRSPLCGRLHVGLIKSRARLLTIEDRQFEHAPVPKEFWWALGHEALEQNWETGDFSTQLKGSGRAQAFGVTFPLSSVLELSAVEDRSKLARSMSVAGRPEWLSAREFRSLAFSTLGVNPALTGRAIIEQARLGMVTARAILAQGSTGDDLKTYWNWEEREWDIPDWFWSDFSSDGSSSQDWELGKFSGSGQSPTGLCWITLSGVHFHRNSLLPYDCTQIHESHGADITRGRKREYDWEAATTAIWGQIFRAELIPINQAQVEKAFQRWLTKGDKEPSESTVRPFANRVWTEFSK